MHNLTPTFLLEQLSHENQNGVFEAVVLFVDTSGFTPLTTTLSEQGRDGAEVLADILQAVFEPLVTTVYEHGGFIAGFAGDAFKAVFPGLEIESYRRALSAARVIQNHMLINPSHETKYGSFNFSVRMSIADGDATWAVWQGDTDEARQRSAYTFAGDAIARAIGGEDHADGGELVVTQSVFEVCQGFMKGDLRGRMLTGDAQGYVAIDGLTEMPIAPSPTPQFEGSSLESASHFYPPSLLTTSTRGEFRPVYTLFINVQQLPEPGTDADFLPLFFRLLHQYGGYLCRIGRIGSGDPGGTFLLFWGAPTSYENDLERVLSFVLELRKQISIPLRAGITHSVVYAGFIGAELREEYTCHGSSVNQAARQMGLAEWDQVLLDQEVARRADERFRAALAGRFELKGFSKPQPLFLLGGRQTGHVNEQFDTDLGRRHFVGRQAELAQLLESFKPIFHGHFGGLTLVSGEAGIGKSRLVHEALALARMQGAQVFRCQADEILRESLNPFRYFLYRYFEEDPSDTDETNKASFDTKLDALIANTPFDSLDDELVRTRSFLGALVNLTWPDSLYERLEPKLRFENTLSALKALFLAESRRQPTIILIEDAHWLDEDSWIFIKQLVRNVDSYPFVLVATMRPMDEATSLYQDVSTQILALSPLATGELSAFAEMQLGDALSDELHDLLSNRGQGNPFFIEQILLYLQEEDLIEHTDAGWQLIGFDAGLSDSVASVLPSDLQTMLIARLDRLSQSVRQVVQTAAVLGREFSVQVLSQMLKEDLSLDEKVQSAEASAVWEAMSELRYLFHHALLRDAAYEMQLQARLQSLHRIAGEAIEELYAESRADYYGELAYHFDNADDNARAIRYLQLAAEQANERYRLRDLITISERLLMRLTEPQEIVSACVMQCNGLVYVGRTTEALNLLLDSESLAKDLPGAEPLVEIKLALGSVYRRLDRKDDALDALQTAAELAANLENNYLKAKINETLGNLYRKSFYDNEKALAHIEQALSYFEEVGDENAIAQEFVNMGSIYLRRGDLDSALSYFQRAANVSERIGNAEVQALAYASLALPVTSLLLVQHLPEWRKDKMYIEAFDSSRLQECYDAVALMEKSLALSKSIGSAQTTNISLVNLGNIYMHLGEFEKATSYLMESLKMAKEIDAPARQARTMRCLGRVFSLVDRLQESETMYSGSLEIYERIDDRREIASTLSDYAELVAKRGWFEDALSLAQRSKVILEETGKIGRNGFNHSLFSLLYVEMGMLSEAVAEVIALLENRAAMGQQYVLGMDHLIIALVLLDPTYAQQDEQTARLLKQFAEKKSVELSAEVNLELAIERASASHQFETAIRAHCELSNYWSDRSDGSNVRHHLAMAKSTAEAHNLRTSAAEVRRTCAKLGIEYEQLRI